MYRMVTSMSAHLAAVLGISSVAKEKTVHALSISLVSILPFTTSRTFLHRGYVTSVAKARLSKRETHVVCSKIYVPMSRWRILELSIYLASFKGFSTEWRPEETASTTTARIWNRISQS